MGSSKPVSRKSDLVIQEHGDEILIYDLTDNRALCLNETSARVWRACDGNNTVEDINKSFGNQDLVWLALEELKRERLINVDSPTPAKFEGMSRREVIRKVGLASVLALPVIAAVAAPTAAQTGSCTVGANCTCSDATGSKGQPCPTTSGGGCGSGCVCIRANAGNTNGTCSRTP